MMHSFSFENNVTKWGGENQALIKCRQIICNTRLFKVSAPWMTVRTIQKEVWMMLDREADVNVVVKMLEEKAK